MREPESSPSQLRIRPIPFDGIRAFFGIVFDYPPTFVPDFGVKNRLISKHLG